MEKKTNLMDWGVHWIGAYRAFKKLMDAGGAGTVVVVVRLGNRRELMVMVMDLILIHHVRGWHDINATWLHSYKTKPTHECTKPKYQIYGLS